MKKSFLTPFVVILASLSTNDSLAISAPYVTPSMQTDFVQNGHVVNTSNGGQFDFILKRNAEAGQMIASHRSHSSHRSHYSSRR